MNTAEFFMTNEDIFVTRAEAQREIEDHQVSFLDFVNDRGERDEYAAWEVLGWLGY